MSLYQLQKCLFAMNRDPGAQRRYREHPDDFLGEFDLTDEESEALKNGDVGLLYVLGVNGQILMHFAAFLGIQWFDYLDMMRRGVEKHGPVRDGIYAMTGGGRSFTDKKESR